MCIRDRGPTGRRPGAGGPVLVRPRAASQHLGRDFFTMQYNSILFVAECVEQQACRGRDDLESEPGGRREVRGAANAQRAGKQDPAEPT